MTDDGRRTTNNRKVIPVGRWVLRVRSYVRPLPLGLALLTLSGLYLLGPARDSMGAGATGALLLHIALGLALILPVGIALARAFHRARHSRLHTPSYVGAQSIA